MGFPTNKHTRRLNHCCVVLNRAPSRVVMAPCRQQLAEVQRLREGKTTGDAASLPVMGAVRKLALQRRRRLVAAAGKSESASNDESETEDLLAVDWRAKRTKR
jgi:hypothetical protein